MAYLENASSLTLISYLPSLHVNAAATMDYSTRFPAVMGSQIGVLVSSGSLQPLQALTSTGIELTTNTTVYVAYIAPKVVITSLGNTLATAITTA